MLSLVPSDAVSTLGVFCAVLTVSADEAMLTQPLHKFQVDSIRTCDEQSHRTGGILSHSCIWFSWQGTECVCVCLLHPEVSLAIP